MASVVQLTINSSVKKLSQSRMLQDLATVDERDLVREIDAVASHTRSFHLVHDLKSFDDFTEHDVLAVQVRRRAEHEAELAAVGVGARVGHLQNVALRMRESKTIGLVIYDTTKDDGQ